MSTIHRKNATQTEKAIHRKFHEIEERTDTNIDTVAEIITLWEEWTSDNLKRKGKTND